jgi:hypothetical protein
MPPALPATAQNQRLKQSHQFTRLLLGKADMRVERGGRLVPAAFFRHSRESGNPEPAPGMNRGRPLRSWPLGPRFRGGDEQAKMGAICLPQTTSGGAPQDQKKS